MKNIKPWYTVCIKSSNSLYPIVFSFLKFIISSPVQEAPLSNVNKVDCALLPPSRKALEMHVRRARYVSILWRQASMPSPTDGITPTDYGWTLQDNLLVPYWFSGPSIPDSVVITNSSEKSNEDENEDDEYTGEEDYDEDDGTWSEESDDSDQES